MENPEPEELFEALKAEESDKLRIVLERGTVEPGTSFSAEALEQVRNQMILFLGARLMAAWEKRGVPPTRCEVDLDVRIQ